MLIIWKEVSWSIWQIGFSPPAISLKHLTSLPFTKLFLTLSEGQIKGVGPTLFHKKNGFRGAFGRSV
jgi:hypothetical protein